MKRAMAALALSVVGLIAGAVGLPVGFVRPEMGTVNSFEFSNGNLYPLIGRPWGMNSWSPITKMNAEGTERWFYDYAQVKFHGIKLTHQLSPWVGDYASLAILPVVGEPAAKRTERFSYFTHKTEIISPARYQVYLCDFHTTLSLAPTMRAAMLTADYHAQVNAGVVIDPFAGGSAAADVAARRVTGKTVVDIVPARDSAAPRQFYSIAFDAEIAEARRLADGAMYIRFKDEPTRRRVNMKFASSYISPEQCERNLLELGDGDFDRIVREGESEWNRCLARVDVDSDDVDRLNTFYTCLYRMLLFPKSLWEVDGEGKIVHWSPSKDEVRPGYYYAGTCFWDTFRALYPFLNAVYPEMVAKMMNGLENCWRESGWLPELSSPGLCNCMIGNNAVSVIADAYLGGIRDGYDINALCEAVLHEVNNAHPKLPAIGRKGCEEYAEKGYVPRDCGINESAARTLEYAYADKCVAKLLKALGRDASEVAKYEKRAQNWRNVFDPQRKIACGRNRDGSFNAKFNEFAWGGDFTEGSAHHYTWSVFHDVDGLAAAMGGRREFERRLDAIFTMPPTADHSAYGFVIHEIREMQAIGLGQYAHGNQPIQHMIYLYNWTDSPQKAGVWARRVMDRLYRPTPDGYCGDEDNGQTSAWYVWSALGMYPVCPVDGEYAFGGPLFKRARVSLANGRNLEIRGPGSEAYDGAAGSITYNGRPVKRLTRAEFTAGGTLVFEKYATPAAPRMGAGEKMHFAGIERVKMGEDRFWSPRFELWRSKTVPDVFNKLEHRAHAVTNFALAASGAKEGHRGEYFFDGHVLETIRGASDYLLRNYDRELDRRMDDIIEVIASAQCADGYLNTRLQIQHPERRWGDNGGFAVDQHEIYNAGCLIEAGVHHYRATGKTKLLTSAIRFAKLMCDTMGPLPKRNLIPTHSLAEEAMVDLVRLAREDAKVAQMVNADECLRLVKFWHDSHGHHCGAPDWRKLGWGVRDEMAKLSAAKHAPDWRPSYGDYQMDRVPLAQYQSIEGHAVRAALLCTGIAAYAVESGDAEYAMLSKRFWESMIGRKLYISGGIGSDPKYEAFVADYELPPDAYLETCAAIGNAFFSAQMAELTGDGKYVDEMERVFYNALLTAVGEDGVHYTYVNPLNTEKGERWDWHGCPCCPPMFLKLTGMLPGYAYGIGRGGEVFVNLFMCCRAQLATDKGTVSLATSTHYPDEGTVEVSVSPESPRRFAVKVRVPGWARGIENPFGLYRSNASGKWQAAVNGKAIDARVENGYLSIEREWSAGDRIGLKLDVAERTITADERVKAIRGKVAKARGPVLMAMEHGKMIPYEKVANHGTCPHKVWQDQSVDVGKR